MKAAQNITQTMCRAPVRDNTRTIPFVAGAFGGAAFIAVLIRCTIRISNFGLDDIFAVATLVAATPLGAIQFLVSADGFGKDIWTIASDKVYRIVKVSQLI